MHMIDTRRLGTIRMQLQNHTSKAMGHHLWLLISFQQILDGYNHLTGKKMCSA
jgi:hypothetical protein